MSGSPAPAAIPRSPGGRRAAPFRWRIPGATPALSVLAGFYLALAFTLGAWVLVARLLLGWHAVVVAGDAEVPGLHPGDVVMIGEPPPDVAPGTVVAVRDPSGGEPVLVRLERDDGQQSAPYDVTALEGVGRLVVPLAGLPLRWLASGEGVPLAIWGAGTAAAVWLALAPARRGALAARPPRGPFVLEAAPTGGGDA